MFQRQMKKYSLETPVVSRNEYNEDILSYTYDRDIEMALCSDSKVMYNGNDSLVFNVDYSALTHDREVKKGDRIDGKYIIEYVEVYRLYTIMHLKEVANSGRL